MSEPAVSGPQPGRLPLQPPSDDHGRRGCPLCGCPPALSHPAPLAYHARQTDSLKTVGDLLELSRNLRSGDVSGLGPRGIGEITMCLSCLGLFPDHRHSK